MKYLILIVSLVFVLTKAFSADDHDHDHEAKANTTSKPNSEKKHAEADAHDHEEEGHDHEKEEVHKESEHKGEEDHDSEGHKKQGSHENKDGHEDHEEGHAEHDEENSQVGPNKGITEASAESGIKLSPEAEKNFGIEKIEVSNPNSLSIVKKALVTSGLETNVYRYRNGFYKRVDFIILSRNENNLVIKSKDLSKGDSIVTKGLGFILIAEIAAFGGAPEGHSH
jgi:hypothetical protein